MTIHEAQRELAQLLSKVRHLRVGAALGLYEEVGELAKALMNWEIYGERDRENLTEECADIFFSLVDISNAYGIDLDAACTRKLHNTRDKVEKWESKYGQRLSKIRDIFDHDE
jgi:NTP pyrophosphatase (non-canonical NTP hydrolase)